MRLAQQNENITQPENKWLHHVCPGVNAESQLVWKDLEQGVDILAGDGKPRFMRTEEFLKLEGALSAVQVARLHDEIWVKPNHDVIGEIFFWVPD